MTVSNSSLDQFLTAADPERAEGMLEDLIFGQAAPLVGKIVRTRLGADVSSQDREDISGEVVLDLLARLQDLKKNPDATPIGNFPGYVAISAYHGCDRYLRQRYPQRHRLKRKLRYVLEKEQAFALWDDPAGTLLCGLATWKGHAKKTGTKAYEFDGLRGFSQERPGELAQAVLEDRGGPMDLDELVGVIAGVWGIRDRQLPLDAVDGMAQPALPDGMEALDRQRHLRKLWAEIVQLPLGQRTALLLNLRDDAGGSALLFLPASGIASIRQIAAVLELRPEELAGMWGRLPLNDLEIAERLRLTRQQIINLRNSARQRLGRRMGRE
jgi:hypothetical protein